jgi:hypothetical protein
MLSKRRKIESVPKIYSAETMLTGGALEDGGGGGRTSMKSLSHSGQEEHPLSALTSALQLYHQYRIRASIFNIKKKYKLRTSEGNLVANKNTTRDAFFRTRLKY